MQFVYFGDSIDYMHNRMQIFK